MVSWMERCCFIAAGNWYEKSDIDIFSEPLGEWIAQITEACIHGFGETEIKGNGKLQTEKNRKKLQTTIEKYKYLRKPFLSWKSNPTRFLELISVEKPFLHFSYNFVKGLALTSTMHVRLANTLTT